MKPQFLILPFVIVVIGLIALPRAAIANLDPFAVGRSPSPDIGGGVGMGAMPGGEVVGDGTPDSCTDTALTQALSGGGHITFNCGPNPHIILLASQKVITAETSLDGAGLITLSGVNLRRHFVVDNTAILTLRNITLTAGAVGTGESGGSVRNNGVLVTQNVTFINNAIATGTGGGGAIYNNGASLLRDTTFVSNRAAAGGALLNTITGTATITNSTFFSNSVLTPNTGFCRENWGGGAIRNEGTLTYTGGTMRGNQSIKGQGDEACGGAINNEGALSLFDIDFDGNIASLGSALYSGAIASLDDTHFINNRDVVTSTSYYVILAEDMVDPPITPALTVRNSDVISNTGAGVSALSGEMTIESSTIANNTLGGVYLVDFLSGLIVNSTISGHDEGISIQRGPNPLRIVNSTLVNRITNFSMYFTSSLSIQNTVLAGAEYNCYFWHPESFPNIYTSEGYNLSDDDTCRLTQTTDFPMTEPLLGPLQDNGGPTETYLPAVNSPLLEHGVCRTDVPTDQRGVARPQGAACDIGAVERTALDGATPTPTVTITATPSATPSAIPTSTATGTPVPLGHHLYLPLIER